jgi:hypothetical protein
VEKEAGRRWGRRQAAPVLLEMGDNFIFTFLRGGGDDFI